MVKYIGEILSMSKPSHVNFRLELLNEGMQTSRQVAAAFLDAAQKFCLFEALEKFEKFTIKDVNGNTVGIVTYEFDASQQF